MANELSADWHAVVADPPYGIGFLHGGGGRGTGLMMGGATKPGQYNTRFHGDAFRVPGDDQPFDPRPLLTAAGKRPEAGVKFIGVEMSERWFDVAVDRVRKYLEATV